uniref:Pyrin domain-containing protein n=1 Tax=Ictidomys tridecemlineatus TaxID=43179 RepID=A0A287DCG6_ICTTR
MVNEYKKIVLLVGLEAIKDYEFRLIKSLLAKDLKLTRNMQEDYDRIRIADLMEEKFHRDAGLGKLITLCKDIPALAELAEILKTRRLKVKRKSKGGRKSTGEKKSTGKKVEQDESPTAQQVHNKESEEELPSSKNPGLTMIPTEASEERGHQKGPKEVVVLKVTEPFIYEFKEGGKKMFHATVATESEFFRVKVFDFHLKAKFIPKTVIAISDYIGSNGFLEIHSASSVSHVSADRKMEISSRLIKNANATPKIEYLCSQCTVKYVNGVYTVYK